MKRTVLDTNILISSVLGGALVLVLDIRSIPIISGRKFIEWLKSEEEGEENEPPN